MKTPILPPILDPPNRGVGKVLLFQFTKIPFYLPPISSIYPDLTGRPPSSYIPKASSLSAARLLLSVIRAFDDPDPTPNPPKPSPSSVARRPSPSSAIGASPPANRASDLGATVVHHQQRWLWISCGSSSSTGSLWLVLLWISVLLVLDVSCL